MTRSTRWTLLLLATALYLALSACKGVAYDPYYTGHYAGHHYGDRCAHHYAHSYPVFIPSPAPRLRFPPPLYRENTRPWAPVFPTLHSFDVNPVGHSWPDGFPPP